VLGFTRKKPGTGLGIGLAALLFAIAVIKAVEVAVNWGGCAYYGFQTDRDTRYAAFVGCMVKVNDDWIPRNELRVLQ
jgi:hypothetical protein